MTVSKNIIGLNKCKLLLAGKIFQVFYKIKVYSPRAPVELIWSTVGVFLWTSKKKTVVTDGHKIKPQNVS